MAERETRARDENRRHSFHAMTWLSLLRNSNSATGVLSRCVSVLSRGQRRSEGPASASASAAFPSFDQRRGIASRSVDDDAASRSTSHPAPNPDDVARVASGAAMDVARVVNQLNSVRVFLLLRFDLNKGRMSTLFRRRRSFFIPTSFSFASRSPRFLSPRCSLLLCDYK